MGGRGLGGGGGGLGLYPKTIVSSEECLAELAQNLTLEKSQGGHKA